MKTFNIPNSGTSHVCDCPICRAYILETKRTKFVIASEDIKTTMEFRDGDLVRVINEERKETP